MRKAILLLAIFGICQIADARLNPQEEGEYDVYLCIGQSNMAGRGKLQQCDSVVIPGVFILNECDSIVPAVGALNRYSTIRKNRKIQGVGPANDFARVLHERTGRNILLVVNARGGSNIKNWVKGAYAGDFNKKEGDDRELIGTAIPSFYDEAVRRCRIAMQHGKLRAILWHQGESNAKDKPALYAEYLSSLARNLRKDLKVGKKVPFIVGETNRNWKNHALINPTLNQVRQYVPNSACVSSEGCPANPDMVHFSREGQRILGERYAEEVIRMVEF